MAPKISAAKPVPSERRPWEGQRVLIVDDAENVRLHLKSMFTAVGMQVAGFAVNGIEALDQIDSLKPDLVSLDIIMPEMDGIECYRKIQALGYDVKCVIISWIGGESSVIESLSKFVPPHLFQAKSLTPRDLTSRLEKIYGIVAVDTVVTAEASKVNEDDLDLEFSSLKRKLS